MTKRLIDIICPDCLASTVDVWLEPGQYPTCECGAQTERQWTSTASAHGDDIPGGIMIEHGLCYPGGAPRRFDTKSSIAKAAKAKGLHWGAFMHGSPSGRRWI